MRNRVPSDIAGRSTVTTVGGVRSFAGRNGIDKRGRLYAIRRRRRRLAPRVTSHHSSEMPDGRLPGTSRFRGSEKRTLYLWRRAL